jgi:glycosyltransferase involved in cell wall biosynthesis
VRRTLRLANVFVPVEERGHDAVSQRMLQAEACLVSTFNVHATIEAIEDFRPDVVYLWNLIGIGGLGLVALLRLLGIPWVWHLMDCVPRTICHVSGLLVPALAEQFSQQLTGQWIACSQGVVEEIAAAGISLGGRTSVLPNWIMGARRPRVRGYLEDGWLRMVFAGAISEFKGVHIAIGAADLLRRSGFTNFSIDLYGDDRGSPFQEMIDRLQLGDCVVLRGHRPHAEMVELYREYDVMLFPTWSREPMAFAPLEATAHGCVPLLTDTCGNSEWFVHGVHLLKAQRTAGAFASAVRDILDGRVDLETIGRRAADVVWRDFHIDAVAARIERVLDDALRAPRSMPMATPAEAYRLALVAEHLLRTGLQAAATP